MKPLVIGDLLWGTSGGGYTLGFDVSVSCPLRRCWRANDGCRGASCLAGCSIAPALRTVNPLSRRVAWAVFTGP